MSITCKLYIKSYLLFLKQILPSSETWRRVYCQSVTDFSETLTASISSVAFRIITNKLLRIQQINNLFFFVYAEGSKLLWNFTNNFPINTVSRLIKSIIVNKIANVRKTQHWGAFVQPLLLWKAISIT